MRVALIVTGAIALALFALYELDMSYPVAWWLYLSVAIVFACALIRPVPVRDRARRFSVFAALITFIAVLYFVNWTTRKPFLRDLARIQVGMSEAEVRQIMGHYMEGTGWPTPPGGNPTNGPGTLTIVGSASQYLIETLASGQMTIQDSLVFRHSKHRAFNSDWGIISLSSGRVVQVEFSPD